MLGERAAPRLEGLEPVEVSPTANWSKSSYVTDPDQPAYLSNFRLDNRTVTASDLSRSPDIIDFLPICQRRVGATHLSGLRYPEAEYQNRTGKAFRTLSSRSSSPCRAGKRTYDVMSFAGESQHPSGVDRGVGYPPVLSEEDVQLQKEEEENQTHEANQAGNARNSVPELSAEYFSGDSDLTAEPMAEGSGSRCSSLEEGCTFALEVVTNDAEPLSNVLGTHHQQHKHGDATACLARIDSAERHNSQRKGNGNADRLDENHPFSFPTSTPATEISEFSRLAPFMQVPGAKHLVSTCANPTGVPENATREIAGRDEGWLQLRLGQTNSESNRVTSARNRQKSVWINAESDAPQDALVTLQLLPPKTEQSTDQCSEENPNEPEIRGDMPIPAIPSAAASYGLADRNSGYLNENMSAPRWASSREFREPIQSPAPAQAAAPFTSLIARMEMNVDQGKRGDRYSVLNRSNETAGGFYMGRRLSWEDQQEANLPRVLESPSTKQPPPYPYEQPRYIGYVDPAFNAEDWRWQKPTAAAPRPPMISTAQPKLLHPWQSSIQSVEAPWQGLARSFTTSLGFQGLPELGDDSLLPWISDHRRKGNPFIVGQTIDRAPSIRSQTRALDSAHGVVTIPATAWNHSASASSRPRRSPNKSGESIRRSPSKSGDFINNCALFDRSAAAFMDPASYTFMESASHTSFKIHHTSRPPPPSSADRLRLVKNPASRGSGIWFTLEAAHSPDDDQELPPMQKMYMRIRDGGVTISVVKKYLASKLGLSSESEVEITCKGKQLLPSFTLQHVRDKIWSAFGIEAVDTYGFKSTNTFSLTTETHIMALFYQRCSHNLTLNLLKL